MLLFSRPFPAAKKLLELVASSRLYHGGHPVLRWNASCLNAKWANDNLMFKYLTKGAVGSSGAAGAAQSEVANGTAVTCRVLVIGQ